MRGLLTRLLFNNLLLKLVSLTLALLLFYLVRAEKQSLAYGTVRVSYTPAAGRILVGERPTTLSLGVLGPASRIGRFRFDDLADVNLDLSQVESGYLKFRPEMLNLPRGFSVASIKPDGFVVRYAAVIERHVPVRVALQGQVAAGFRVVQTRADPPRVVVRGPEAALARVTDLPTRPVSVEAATASLVARVRLGGLPAKCQLKRGESLEVDVAIEIARMTPQITLSSIRVALPVELQRALHVEPEKVDALVAGPPQVLADLARGSLVARVAVPAAVAQNPENLDTPIKVAPRLEGLPAGVTVRRIDPMLVLVSRRQPVRTKEPGR